MSLFRKPKKPIQRRQLTCADDDDDEPMDEDRVPAPPPPPRIKEQKNKDKTPAVAKQTLLSFADEVEDGEVFRVKKSSQSKKLARRREREKELKELEMKMETADTNSRDIASPIKDVPEKEERGAKKEKKLEGMILSGRAALAAEGLGDVEDDDDKPVEELEEGEGGFHTYRPESVRAALYRGQIPDAALIHAARKTRQQAREVGKPVDFIPVGEGRGKSGGEARERGRGSRLVREDGSGDEDEDADRIHVAVQLKSDSIGAAALDSEGEEWEEQQLLKARPHASVALPDMGMEGVEEGGRFSLVAPPPPCLEDAPAHLRPLLLDQQPPGDAGTLLLALTDRLMQLRSGRLQAAEERGALADRLLRWLREREARRATAPQLERDYRTLQATRAYLVDLLECIDEKLPELETLEKRALLLHKKRCEFVQERRRADVRDQAQDVMAPPGRGSAVGASVSARDAEEKQRRCAEREGRRRARRLRREQFAAPAASAASAASAALAARQHLDGDSTDDELPADRAHLFSAEYDTIRQRAATLWADALPAWRSARGVCARLARLRRAHPARYTDAYLPDVLPKLLAPYVRTEIILWNPLADEHNEDYEKMDWFKCLMMYGVKEPPVSSDSEASRSEGEGGDAVGGEAVTEASARDDPDAMLVPAIVHKVVVPKVTELVEHAWDPVCVRSAMRLRAFILRASSVPGARRGAQGAHTGLAALGAEARARLLQALASDVFLPALPPSVFEGKGGVFWRRCLGAGVRLLRAVLALCPPPHPLHADALALKLIGTLCVGAGAAPVAQCAHACAALASTLPRANPALRAAALARIGATAARVANQLETDNPLHHRSLEQMRAVLAECRDAQLNGSPAL